MNMMKDPAPNESNTNDLDELHLMEDYALLLSILQIITDINYGNKIKLLLIKIIFIYLREYEYLHEFMMQIPERWAFSANTCWSDVDKNNPRVVIACPRFKNHALVNFWEFDWMGIAL